MNYICPKGYEYCRGVQCSHWTLKGWCEMSNTSRTVNADLESLQRRLVAIEKETLVQQDHITSLKKMLSDAQNIIEKQRKPK